MEHPQEQLVSVISNVFPHNLGLRMRRKPTPQQKPPEHRWTCLVICASELFFCQNKRLCLWSSLSEVLQNRAKSDKHSNTPTALSLVPVLIMNLLERSMEKVFSGKQNTRRFGVWKLIDAFCIGNVIQMGSVCSSNAPTSSKIAAKSSLKHGLLLQVLFLKWI